MPIEKVRYRTQYDEAQAIERDLAERVQLAGGPYRAPEELIDKDLAAAQKVWRLRARIRRRR